MRKFILFVVLGLIVAGLVLWRHDDVVAPIHNLTKTNNSNTTKKKTFNKNQYSANDPASLWVVVNKGRVLPSSYAPQLVVPKVPNRLGSVADDSHLRPDAATALEQMFAAAKQSGYSLRLYSGYRSYNNQVATYNGFVKSDGVAKADTYSARPGHSEHQTGLAADISSNNGKCNVQQCFAGTPEGQWLSANAANFGFILRYGKTTESLTGYEYEPWHFRYVGTALAAEIIKNSQTLEQFFNLTTYKLSDAYPTDQYRLESGS